MEFAVVSAASRMPDNGAAAEWEAYVLAIDRFTARAARGGPNGRFFRKCSMDLSIIIPTLNEAECIERCIKSAWALDPREVIVVDGGSTDETVRLAEPMASKMLSTPRGRGTQQSAGAELARSNALLFLHADTWLEPDAGRQLATALARPATQFGGFRQCIAAAGVAFRLIERGNAWRARYLRLVYGDQGIFVRRRVFVETGGFPHISLMEDVELSRRMRRRTTPVLLPGPLHVSARRWQRNGVLRQTLCNWSLLASHLCGRHPDALAEAYAAGERSRPDGIDTELPHAARQP